MIQPRYSSMGQIITVTAKLDDLPFRDRINLLHSLMLTFDPGLDGYHYEEYQQAAETVLKVAGRYWESGPTMKGKS